MLGCKVVYGVGAASIRRRVMIGVLDASQVTHVSIAQRGNTQRRYASDVVVLHCTVRCKATANNSCTSAATDHENTARVEKCDQYF